jgi:hypothetical protein
MKFVEGPDQDFLGHLLEDIRHVDKDENAQQEQLLKD